MASRKLPSGSIIPVVLAVALTAAGGYWIKGRTASSPEEVQPSAGPLPRVEMKFKGAKQGSPPEEFLQQPLDLGPVGAFGRVQVLDDGKPRESWMGRVREVTAKLHDEKGRQWPSESFPGLDGCLVTVAPLGYTKQAHLTLSLSVDGNTRKFPFAELTKPMQFLKSATLDVAKGPGFSLKAITSKGKLFLDGTLQAAPTEILRVSAVRTTYGGKGGAWQFASSNRFFPLDLDLPREFVPDAAAVEVLVQRFAPKRVQQRVEFPGTRIKLVGEQPIVTVDKPEARLSDGTVIRLEPDSGSRMGKLIRRTVAIRLSSPRMLHKASASLVSPTPEQLGLSIQLQNSFRANERGEFTSAKPLPGATSLQIKEGLVGNLTLDLDLWTYKSVWSKTYVLAVQKGTVVERIRRRAGPIGVVGTAQAD
ncbi:MAG: hypothetical protein ACAH95_01890 [Fimbriimonas sp.]